MVSILVKSSDLSISDHLKEIDNLELGENEGVIARPIVKEIKDRLTFLNNVGLNYLTLSRMAGTLSGGESQRIRLATQIGSNLSGVYMFWMSLLLGFISVTMIA